LSAARAANVVNVLMKNGVRPERMAAIGYGEHQPIADNRTEQGRLQNRRVVLVIMGNTDSRYETDVQPTEAASPAPPAAIADSSVAANPAAPGKPSARFH